MNDRHCPWCQEVIYGRPNKRFCRRSHMEMYNRKLRGVKRIVKKPELITQEMVQRQERKPKCVRGIFRRGTLDMPKCNVKGCHNHLYWNCEKGWGICIHHHNLNKRRNHPRNMPTIPAASFAG